MQSAPCILIKKGINKVLKTRLWLVGARPVIFKNFKNIYL